MGLITHILTQTCSIVDTTQDIYGDQKKNSATEYPCRFREIKGLTAFGINREDLDADAMVWFEPDVPVSEGTIIKFGDDYYRVIGIVTARRLAGSTVYFIKCSLEAHKEVPDGS